MIQQPPRLPLLFITVAAILALHASASLAETGLPERPRQTSGGLPDYLTKLAGAEHEAATARLAIAFDRLKSIEALHKDGHASFRELLDAKVEASTLKRQNHSARRFCERVNEFTDQADVAEQSDPRLVIIPIPGMQGHSTLRILGHLVLPSPDWLHPLESNFQNYPKVDRLTPADAWKSLIHRLEGIEINDAAFAKEKQQAERKYELAVAEQAIADLLTTGIYFFRGDHARTAEQNLCQAFAAADGLKHLAMAQSSAEALKLVKELQRRTERAAKLNAAPEREVFVVAQRMEFYTQQHKSAQRTWESITAKRDHSLNGHTFVTSNRFASEALRTGVSPIQLDLAATAALERVVAAAEYASIRDHELQRLKSSLERITQLAAKESYFANEQKRIEFKVQLTTAELTKANLDHKQSMLIHDYVVARLSSTDGNRSTWMQPIANLFRLRSESTANEQFAAAAVADAQWRLDALRKLRKPGATSWKELRGAETRLSQFQQAERQAKHERKLARAIHKLLAEEIAKYEKDVDFRG